METRWPFLFYHHAVPEAANFPAPKTLGFDRAHDKLRPSLRSWLRLHNPPPTLELWGVRGSIPVPGPTTLRYGGNTTCVELRVDGQIVILDSGTGIRALGHGSWKKNSVRNQSTSRCSSRTCTGITSRDFRFFPLLSRQEPRPDYGLRWTNARLQETLAGQMSAPFFPVQLQALPGESKSRNSEERIQDRQGLSSYACE